MQFSLTTLAALRWRAVPRLQLAATATALLALTTPARAQADTHHETAPTLQNVLFTGGTTTTDAAGRNWAYIIWQADKPQQPAHPALAIYAKAGDPSSSANYVRRSIVTEQTDPLALQALINTAASLGGNGTLLGQQVDSLFQSRFNGSSLGLSEKLSAALRATDDPEARDNLEFLARSHPSVAMALGQAYATPISAGKTTFEIRVWDLAAKQDLTVIGRVTVTAGEPELLPPPGPPVQVPDVSPQGHLNARFRWGTPSLLNQFAFLQHGFNLYRVPADLAEQNRLHVQPPPASMLRQMVASGQAAQVNRLPILADEELTHEEASNLNPAQGGDPETYYITDNHRRFEPGERPFSNGQRFYYFVTARDLLGRDGYVSLGTLVTICDRRPPPIPRGLTARNEHVWENGVASTFLQLTWDPVRDADTTVDVVYHVYRWEDPKELQLHGRSARSNLVASVAQDPNCTSCPVKFADRGAGAPVIPGKTYWYTLRVEDRAACGGNLSAHSGPVPGVLRDFDPPVSPSGQVWIHCGSPRVDFKTSTLEDTQDKQALDPTVAYYQLHCTIEDPRIEWLNWYVSFGGAREFIGRQYVSPGGTNVVFPYKFSRFDSAKVVQQRFICEAGSRDGKISPPAEAQFQGVARTTEIRHAHFTASYVVQRLVADRGCEHDPNPQNRPNTPWTPIEVQFIPPAQSLHGLLEWKLYRQVDSEPMTLIAQGTNAPLNAVPVVFRDISLPVHDATVCYFLRYVNRQASASPLRQLACVSVRGTAPLPKPVLAAIESAGTAQSPRMRLRWFCSPYGVERFELRVNADTPLPIDLGSELSTNLIPQTSPGTEARTGHYRTGRVAGDFMPGPVFTIEVPVTLGAKIVASIHAVSLRDSVGPASNAEEFTWHNVPAQSVSTPWPARGLPALNSGFNDELSATQFAGNIPPLGVSALLLPATNGFAPAAVRIGEVVRVDVSSKGELYMPASQDPLSNVYQTTNGVRLCPFVLYRSQLPNERFPRVSGDVTQVSPMIEHIAYQRGTWNGVDVTFLRDPFFTVLPAATSPGRPQLALRDTQPLVAGARYQYFLVHFGRDGEPDMVVPTNSIELPSREPAL